MHNADDFEVEMHSGGKSSKQFIGRFQSGIIIVTDMLVNKIIKFSNTTCFHLEINDIGIIQTIKTIST